MGETQPGPYDLVVIGGGQAGLAAGRAGQLAGLRCVILDAEARTGDTWRHRYDSLTLFTPRAYSQLPGLVLEGDPHGYPTKDELADYLAAYARTFNLPIHHSRPVRGLSSTSPGALTVAAGDQSLETHAVVVATGPFQLPRVPPWTDKLAIPHTHSTEYRNPAQTTGTRVLVVGGGNSGAQIAEELARHGRSVTWAVSGAPRFVPEVVLGRSVFWWLDATGILSAHRDSRRGRFLRRRGDPIFGGALRTMIKDGRVRQAPAAVGANDDTVEFADGSRIAVDAVIWCTGFANDYDWLNIPGVLGPNGLPAHGDGISTADARVGFVGLGWQYSRQSALVCGAAADASRIIERLTTGSR